MKKIFLFAFIVHCLQFSHTKAQWVTIPDPNFVNWLTANYPGCMNGNQMDTTCTGIVNETYIYWGYDSISDLSGIEYFDNLTFLNCSNIYLNSLQALPSSLEILDCSFNNLTILPVLPNSLHQLNCTANLLNSLPVLPNNLDTLKCYQNQFSNLPTLPDSLKYLSCGNNQLDSLPSLPNSLVYLECNYASLSSLPPLPATLTFLQIHYNQLTSLPSLPNTLQSLRCVNNNFNFLPQLPGMLKYLECSGNQLTNLPVLPNSLIELDCADNQLSSLPALPNGLEYLDCAYNLLTFLPTLPDSLGSLICSFNQLISLPVFPNELYYFKVNDNNIQCLSHLPQVSAWTSTFYDISNNPLTCVPNQTIYSLGLPLCMDNDLVNNPNYCSGVANIVGNIFTDMNSNCNYDTTDLKTENIPVKLLDNQNNLLQMSYTVSGVYSFTLLQPDTFTVKIDDNMLPVAMNCGQLNNQSVMLDSTNQTILNIDFPVMCDTVYDINIHSSYQLGLVFPGQIHQLHTNITNNETWYNINCGSSNNSGPAVITITGPVTFISSTSGALIPTVVGNTFSYNVTDFNSLTPSSFGLILKTDTTAQTGDQICLHVEINPSPMDADTTNNVYDFCYNVVNSYDPNMKEVYPVNVLPGYDDWFTYTIHFQNTGNSPAFNIRLRDTLDANLDINTFEVRGYSHPAQVSINGNILTVRFNNIMLPDSTTDYEESMGYFQYRLKPLANLPNGTQIENTAYIYFDYNAPIITNTTLNNFDMTVKTNDIILEEEHYVLYPNPSTGIFMFRENRNIKSVEVFNIMGELVLSQGNAKIINLQAFPKGIYMARINGTQVCRLVKE